MMKVYLSTVFALLTLTNFCSAWADVSIRDTRLTLIQSEDEESMMQEQDDEDEDFSKQKFTKIKSVSSTSDIPVTIGDPSFSGSGCPENTVGVALTPDKKTLSLVFDSFIAQAGESVSLQKDTKICTLHIPMKIPKGLQFTLVKMDYRGYNLVPANAKNLYVTRYTMLDSQRRPISRTQRRHFDFKGPLDDVYTLSSQIKNTIWSPCGKNVNLKIQNRIVATSNKQGEDSMATIDSIDASVGSMQAGYQLMWRHCSQR